MGLQLYAGLHEAVHTLRKQFEFNYIPPCCSAPHCGALCNLKEAVALVFEAADEWVVQS